MSTSMSMIKRTRASKLNALGAIMAINLARDNGDPMYKKYSKIRNKFVMLKKMIIKKYANRGKMQARTAMSKSSSPDQTYTNKVSKTSNMTSDIKKY